MQVDSARRTIILVSSLGAWLSMTTVILATESDRAAEPPDAAQAGASRITGPSVNDVVIVEAAPPTTLGSSYASHGYYEYRFHLFNHSQEEKRVTLELPATEYGSGDRIRQLRRDIVLAPNTPASVALFQPPLPIGGKNARITVNGTSEVIPVALNRHCENVAPTTMPISVLASKTLGSDFYSAASSASGASPPSPIVGSTSSSTVNLGVFLSESEVAQWPLQWLGYSRYDGVALAATDIRKAPAAVMEALRQYVAVGGTLLVLGAWQPPREWNALPSARSRINEYFVGFGVCVAMEESDVNAVGSRQWARLQNHWQSTAAPFRTNHEVEKLNTFIPVAPELQIPVAGMLILMISFALVLGPVNLYLLERYRKRMWLLWTVPAISLFFCAAVWGFAMLNEGWEGNERTFSVTILDQVHQQAATVGWAAFYQPLTPGGGLRYSRDTELTPQVGGTSSTTYRRSFGRARTVNWTDQQQLTTGWVVARVPAYFLVRKPSVTVRERINVKRDTNGSVNIVNGLGADVEDLYYRDPSGRLYQAGKIGTGRSATLNEVTDSAETGTAKPDARREIYGSDWLMRTPSFVELNRETTVSAQLQPGTYMARLSENPFIESGLDDHGNRDASALVIGIVMETNVGESVGDTNDQDGDEIP